MKTRHLLFAISIMAIWGVNFSVIKLGLATVNPLLVCGLLIDLDDATRESDCLTG
jgi:O-acetylserine/cysteine efflux transporter